MNESTGFDWGGLLDAASGAAKNALGLFGQYNQMQAQTTQLDAQTKIAMLNANTQATVAQIQANSAIRNAQLQNGLYGYLGGANSYDPNMTTSLGNMQSVLGRGTNMMTWLALAGVVLAVMQYAKK